MLGFVCFALGKGEACIFELVFDLSVREKGQIQSGGRGKNDPKNNQRGVRTVEAHFSIKRKMQSMKTDANAEGRRSGELGGVFCSGKRRDSVQILRCKTRLQQAGFRGAVQHALSPLELSLIRGFSGDSLSAYLDLHGLLLCLTRLCLLPDTRYVSTAIREP